MNNILYSQLFTAATEILGRVSVHDDGTFYITKSEFNIFNDFGLIVPVDKGGFIKAPLHSEGGVKLLCPDGDKYIISAELEGYEFIMNPRITIIAENELRQLNEKFLSQDSKDFVPYEIPSSVTILDGSSITLHGFELPKFLVSSGQPQYIINKYSTRAAYDILEELNASG